MLPFVKRRFFTLWGSLMLPLLFGLVLRQQLLAATAVPQHLTVPSQKIAADLQMSMAETDSHQPLAFMVYLPQKADLSVLGQVNADKISQRTAVVEQLQATAVAAQAPLYPLLDQLQQSGDVYQYQPLWIVNAIAVTGNSQAIANLANRPEVATIQADALVEELQPASQDQLLQLLQTSRTTDDMTRPWGIDRIGAPQVWHGLGIDGQGVTVAIMDSGVDFTHPDLVANYRGNLGDGQFLHEGHWYNTYHPTDTVPVDRLGHGTHVAGTAVGGNGLGVAPGAQWIAVNISTPDGRIYSSQAHAGFQWLLAPAGDPSLAPDIVNGSWGGQGVSQQFVDDLNALHAAGIMPVFSAGNSGPFTQTVGFPANYANTLAVGASDDIDAVAWFSSMGPSPLTDEIKPWVVAPGARVLSALPNGAYGYNNGTSMAAPHVTGAIALLLAANPTLSYQQVRQILADTAVPLSDHPNMESGWGRLDVYTAVQTQRATGTLAGSLRANGQPLANVAITVTNSVGQQMRFFSDANGQFQAPLLPGQYQLDVAPFGYYAHHVANASVVVGQSSHYQLQMTRLPSGTVTGVLQDGRTGEPIGGAAVQVEGTPATAVTDSDGRYTFVLPSGSYSIAVHAAHYRLSSQSVELAANQQRELNFSLQPSPMTLIIDSGQWYYASQVAYYEEALQALARPYAVWSIRHPWQAKPTAVDLAPYEQLIWSAPEDSPGAIGWNTVLTDFLGNGGGLLVSGQNVGAYDGYGFGTQVWWYRDLEAEFLGKTAVTQTISGLQDGLFADLAFGLNGGDSANNQALPDVAQSQPGALSQTALQYSNGYPAGLQAGHCQPGRIVYLGFGLEGVDNGADRQALVERSFDFFAQPRLSFGVTFTDEAIDDFAIPASTHVYTLTIRNLSEVLTDTFSISSQTTGWASSLLTETITLGPCQTGQTVLRLHVPGHVPADMEHQTEITAVSSNHSTTQSSLWLHHKTPGQILFVDDDRWYDQESHLIDSLAAMGLRFDVWETGWRQGNQRQSPPTRLLHEYDFIIWYTGYDWLAPLLSNEVESLTAYLQQGGRLFLTSQDFLYYHHRSSLARHYLGVMDYREAVTPTLLYGGNPTAVDPALSGPLVLSRGHYLNNADGLIPFADGAARPFFWHDSGMPAGIANQGESWRSIFWALPFEWLPDEDEAAAMAQIVAWLSDLGDSTFVVDSRVGTAVESRTYTLTVANVPTALSNQVRITNSLPAELTLLPGSVEGGAVYDAARHELRWRGTLGPGQSHQIVYQATVNGGATAVSNTVQIGYARHQIQFERTAVFWLDGPDLSGSSLTAVPNQPHAASEVAYWLTLHNSGLSAAEQISANIRLPNDLTVISDTLLATSGVSWLEGSRVIWQGGLAPGEVAMVRILVRREDVMGELWLPATAVVEDGVTGTLLKEHFLHLSPYKQYFPVITQN